MGFPRRVIHLDDAFPEIVCLCGSPRFAEEFDRAGLDISLRGSIVLTIGTTRPALARSLADGAGGFKPALDWLHKRKIDLCDRVLVLNIGGYIGASTRSEIEYAHAIGKPVEYVEPERGGA